MDNTIKLRVILLCFVFAIFGYTIGNFNTLKAQFCAPNTEQTVSQADVPDDINSSIYITKEGDTLEKVAKLFNVSKESLIKENNLKTTNFSTGTMFLIPKN